MCGIPIFKVNMIHIEFGRGVSIRVVVPKALRPMSVIKLNDL